MIDPRSSDIDGIGRDADRGSPPGLPRWVKVLGLVVVAALVLVALLLLGGGHGPARHASAGDTGGIAPATAAATSG